MSTAPAGIALPTLDRLDWPALEAWLDESGFAMTPPLLTPEQCAEVRDMFGDDERFRSTVAMAPARLRRGQLPVLRRPAAAADARSADRAVPVHRADREPLGGPAR